MILLLQIPRPPSPFLFLSTVRRHRKHRYRLELAVHATLKHWPLGWQYRKKPYLFSFSPCFPDRLPRWLPLARGRLAFDTHRHTHTVGQRGRAVRLWSKSRCIHVPLLRQLLVERGSATASAKGGGGANVDFRQALVHTLYHVSTVFTLASLGWSASDRLSPRPADARVWPPTRAGVNSERKRERGREGERERQIETETESRYRTATGDRWRTKWAPTSRVEETEERKRRPAQRSRQTIVVGQEDFYNLVVYYVCILSAGDTERWEISVGRACVSVCVHVYDWCRVGLEICLPRPARRGRGGFREKERRRKCVWECVCEAVCVYVRE